MVAAFDKLLKSRHACCRFGTIHCTPRNNKFPTLQGSFEMKTGQTLSIRRIFKNSVRMYFAPLTGAFKGVQAELRRSDREIASRTKEESQSKAVTHA
jgi:hypothetical protein